MKSLTTGVLFSLSLLVAVGGFAETETGNPKGLPVPQRGCELSEQSCLDQGGGQIYDKLEIRDSKPVKGEPITMPVPEDALSRLSVDAASDEGR